LRALRDVKRRSAGTSTRSSRSRPSDTVLPDARRRAGNLKIEGDPIAAALVVRKRRTAPFMTTRFRGSQGPGGGLLEFGGTVRAEIRPRRKKALVVNGQPVARVTKARHYRAHKFMFGAVDAKLDVFGDRARD
jgi:hypothetical protein